MSKVTKKIFQATSVVLLTGLGMFSLVAFNGKPIVNKGSFKYIKEQKNKAIVKDTTIYSLVDVKAVPVDGIKAFYEDFSDKLKMNTEVLKNCEGSLKQDDSFLLNTTLKMVVEKDGTLSNVSAKGNCVQANEACLRLLKEMKPWEPALVNGKAVRSSFVIPIKIEISI